MEFGFSKEHALLKQMYREFAENEVKPLAAEVDEMERFPVETVEKMVKAGFMGIPFPICPCRFCTSRWTRQSMHPKMAARRRESAVTGSFFSIGRPSGRR